MLQKTPAAKHWKKIGCQSHHGICVFLSSLHHKECGGIGEFSSLMPMIDWCAKVGFDVLQLLPLNDTGRYISPYSLMSAFALHPMYLDVKEYCSDADWKKLRHLAKTEWVQQEKVWEIKVRVLRQYYEKEKTKCRKFVQENDWVKEYASFRGDEGFHQFLQCLCFKQMEQVKRYAEKKGVFLMGDLPILIDFESADLAQHPDMFYHDFSAGAPPDSFSAKGQNWGFPVYDFEHHFDSIMHWWKKRLKVAKKLYHLYRIDHVVGFFRMWAVPKEQKNSRGGFIPKQKKKWHPQGEKILREFLKSTEMLPIAEDLGVIPHFVRQCLSELGIPGTKVMRWEKKKHYIPIQKYPFCSMTTVSTHDTETLQQWWKNHPEEAKEFAQFMGWKWRRSLPKEYQREILEMSHQSPSLFHINLLQEYFPLVEGLTWPGLSHERINNPGRNLKVNWRYRMRPSIEDLLSHQELIDSIRELFDASDDL